MSENLHDAQLLGITIEQASKNIKLDFVTLDDKRVSILLEGIKGFRCDNFLEGNTVLSISIESNAPVDIKKLSELYDDLSKPYVKKIHEQIEAGELILFVLASSYGAEITSIAEKSHVERF